MNIHFFSSSPSLSLVCFLLVILVKIQSSLGYPDIEPHCERQFQCGNITARYPFFRGDRSVHCGHHEFKLDCEDDQVPTMMINDVKYLVLDINPKAQTLKIAKILSYLHGFCPNFTNTTFDPELFKYSDAYENVALNYRCLASPNVVSQDFELNGVIYEDDFIQVNGDKYDGPGVWNANVTVPVPKHLLPARKANWSEWQQVLQQGFVLKWNIEGVACEECIDSKGSCVFDLSANRTFCKCSLTPQVFLDKRCPSEKKGLSSAAVAGIVAGGVAGITVLVFLFVFIRKRRKIAAQSKTRDLQNPPTCNGTSTTTTSLSQSMCYPNGKENVQNMEAFVRNFGSLVPQRFDYSDVKKMTNSFSKKLGQEGYGDVYQGKLADGRLAAVKLLKESKGNGEEFINEVASISRTSHVNIVTLLGFCYSRNKKALIYEFVSNGSLDKFIYDKKSSSTHQNLEWKTRYQIAVGIARGLEYLHRGCNTRIIHFDIKPHNILLDEDFCPKISDFGLAKLCKRKESIISSVLGARGTVGYIAPEVFCRTFGEVSHKSDVYSYGMMILEMVGGRQNIDAIVSHTSEIYFPNWIYKQLEPDKDFEFHGVVTEEEKEIAKKMMIASMWCIQSSPSDRPSMSKVVEMLEGSLESLQIPPKPSLSLPARSPKHSIPSSSFSTSTSSHKPASQEKSAGT